MSKNIIIIITLSFSQETYKLDSRNGHDMPWVQFHDNHRQERLAKCIPEPDTETIMRIVWVPRAPSIDLRSDLPSKDSFDTV